MDGLRAGRIFSALLTKEGWLERQVGQGSVTEPEMLHGVLNNPEMADRAFFYLR